MLLLWYVCDALGRPRPLLDTTNHHRAEIRPTTGRQLVIEYDEAERWRSGTQSGSGGVSYKVLKNAGETQTI